MAEKRDNYSLMSSLGDLICKYIIFIYLLSKNIHIIYTDIHIIYIKKYISFINLN